MLQGFAGCEVGEILSREVVLQIEHVGEKAAYLKTPTDDVIIFSKNLLTPYSVAFMESWQDVKTRLSMGAELRFKGPDILLGEGFGVRLTPADGCAKLQPAAEINPVSFRTAYNVYQILSSASSPDDENEEAVKIVKNFPVSGLLDALEHFVGRGTGLTPAGDDFVSGVLLGLRFCGINLPAERLVRKAAVYSRWPSWKMLEHSSHGCAFTPIYRLSKSLMDGRDAVDDVISSVRIGASTGMAVVSGFLETVKRFHISLSSIRFRSSSISAGGDHSMSITSTP